MSFIGEFHHTVDGKGRISIPSIYRDIIRAAPSEKLIITTEMEPCLVVYPVQEWEFFLADLGNFSRMDPKGKQVRRSICSKANPCSLDKQGRILIPMSLRKYAGLGENACVIGGNKYFEIWHPELWSENQDSPIDSAFSV